MTRTQTRGRGRRGKQWKSPAGGLWFSVILRPGIRPRQAGVLQLYAGVSVQKAIKERTGVDLGLKWPNDIILTKRKLGGILVEAKTVGDELRYAIIGIGLNVNVNSRHLPKGAISLWQAMGRRLGNSALLRTIVQTLESNYPLVQRPESLAEKWWDSCVHRAKMVHVIAQHESVVGWSQGVKPNGSLLVKTLEGRVVQVSEGTLRVLGN